MAFKLRKDLAAAVCVCVCRCGLLPPLVTVSEAFEGRFAAAAVESSAVALPSCIVAAENLGRLVTVESQSRVG